ncbi:MAG: hypothetical protein V4469_01980 [Patescibacteria group bacterium]
MKTCSSLQELADWLVSLNPSGALCYPCALGNWEPMFSDDNIDRALKVLKEAALPHEAPIDTLLRLLNQFILKDLKIPRKKFETLPIRDFGPKKGLEFSFKAFNCNIIAQLEFVTGETLQLTPGLRKEVNERKSYMST